MKNRLILPSLLSCLAFGGDSFAQSAFHYQGSIENGGAPLSGTVSLRFTIYDAESGGSTVGAPATVEQLDVAVTNGLIYAKLDFGDAFDGTARWLELEVDPDGTAGPAGFDTLTPRVHILPAPYAIYAENAGIAQSVINDAVDDADADPTNELQDLSSVLGTGNDAGNANVGNLRRVDINGPTTTGAFNSSRGNSGLRVGVDGGLNTSAEPGNSYGNIVIGNQQIFTSSSSSASQGLTIQTQDNPTTEGGYRLLSVRSSGGATRFSAIGPAEAGYASQFHDSLAVGAEGGNAVVDD
ncbi:MAG: hypothetical protein RLY93_05215 [Sumerlaeia bacterium]